MRKKWRHFCVPQPKANLKKRMGEKIAIIGAGPAGLSAAHDLALMGFKPTVFEIEPVAAGMLAVGVPAYRLPRELIDNEVKVIEALGVEISCGVTIGKDISFAKLRKDFSAVIITVGAKSSRSLSLKGENGPGVFGGVDLLRAVSLGEEIEVGREVVVIGGGNVAYDVATNSCPANRLRHSPHRRPFEGNSPMFIFFRSKVQKKCPPIRLKLSRAMKKELNVKMVGDRWKLCAMMTAK